MTDRDKRKQSLYFKLDLLQDLQGEAERLDRSLSWIVQKACKLALNDLRGMPGLDGKPSPKHEKAS